METPTLIDDEEDTFDTESMISSPTIWIENVSIMKPTKRSVALEIGTTITAFGQVSLNLSQNTNIYLKIPFSMLFIIMSLTWLYLEINRTAIKHLYFSFRGFVIITALITIIICDWTRHIAIHSNNNATYNLIIDDISWSIAILILMGADCIPKISKFIRFVGPPLIVANCFWNMFNYNGYTDIIFFTHKHGKFTLNQIEIAATFQIALFGSTYIVSAARDVRHKYFVILNKRMKKKLLLPIKDYGREFTQLSFFGYMQCEIRTTYFFISIIVLGVAIGIIYMIDTFIFISLFSYDLLFALNFLNVFLLVVVISIIVYNHFEVAILTHLIKQFRCVMLLVSVVFNLYTSIQQVVWGEQSIDIIYSLAFCSGICVMIMRDGMLVSYPFYFSICLCVGMTVISCFNLYKLTFDAVVIEKPSWFIILKREPFYQITVFSMLILFNMLRDWKESKYEKYFVLIRKNRKCKELFYAQEEDKGYDNNVEIRKRTNSDIELVEMI